MKLSIINQKNNTTQTATDKDFEEDMSACVIRGKKKSNERDLP